MSNNTEATGLISSRNPLHSANAGAKDSSLTTPLPSFPLSHPAQSHPSFQVRRSGSTSLASRRARIKTRMTKSLDSNSPKLPSITLRHDFTDGDSSRWPTTNTESHMFNRAGMFRIDDPIANALCPPQELLRRNSVLRAFFSRVGTGLHDARMQRTRGGPSSARSFSFSLDTSSAISCNKKRKRSHRQIPKQCGPIQIKCQLTALPRGISLFQIRRPDGSYDTYICGSECGEFDSGDSYIPHLAWVDWGMLNGESCTCKQCARVCEPSAVPVLGVKRKRGDCSEDDTDEDGITVTNQRNEPTLNLIHRSSSASTRRDYPTTTLPIPPRSNTTYRALALPNPTRRFSADNSPPFSSSTLTLIPLGRDKAGERHSLLAQTSYSAMRHRRG